MRLVLVGIVAVFMLVGGGSTRADFVVCDPRPVDKAINSPGARHPGGCCFLHDGLKLYFTSGRDPSNTNSRELWVAERESADAPWGEAVNLGPNINQPTANESDPAISPDDLELYFQQYRYGGGGYHWMRSTRASKDDPWGPAADFTALGDGGLDFASDGLSVYFSSRRAGGYGDRDIWVATRATTDNEWGEPVNFGPNVNDAGGQLHPSISSDGLALFFADWTTKRIFMCTRTTTNDIWGTRLDLGPAVNAQRARRPEISPDGSTLYFSSADSPVYRQISIKPVVDFDDDGEVGINDLLTMIESWGTDNTLCDIGPMPWGDGEVDEADLEVLMEHWGEKTPIYTVVDDFEGYNDDVDAGTTIWQTWWDGFGVPANGSLVGYEFSPFAEQRIVHGGYQSMPFYYDNSLALSSEATRLWGEPQDWTRRGVKRLTLWIHGQSDNDPEPPYVALGDSSGNNATIMKNDPAVTTVEEWQQLSFDLAAFAGVSADAITDMTFGVGDKTDTQPGGTGTIFVDDIELHLP
jgi:hypothetical protein